MWLSDETRLLRMSGHPGMLCLAPLSWHRCKSAANLPQPVLFAPGSCCPALEEDTPGEEKGARGSESGRGVTGAPQIGHLRCEPSFMFRVCKYSSKLMAQRPELCHLISRVCHLHGHGRTWTVTRGLGPTVLCWPEGGPITLI